MKLVSLDTEQLLELLNEEYRTYFLLKKSTFKPPWARKKIDYKALVDPATRNVSTISEINNLLQNKASLPKRLKDFSQALDLASGLLLSYIYSQGSDEYVSLSVNSDEDLTDSFYKADKSVNKLADKT